MKSDCADPVSGLACPSFGNQARVTGFSVRTYAIDRAIKAGWLTAYCATWGCGEVRGGRGEPPGGVAAQ